MPHHSGGGSHSGGSHGSSGGGRGGSGPVISKKPFSNSRKFRYYDRNGLEHYVYSTRMPKKMSTVTLIISLLMFAPFLFGGVVVVNSFIDMLKPIEPLTPVYESSDVHIEDNIGIINNDSSLESVMKDFEDLTGISPYIITVYDSDWKHNSEYDLVDYSYDLYVNHFGDEQHFLIVYSEPRNAAELDYVDWSWEAMQGDDTDPILTEENFGRFQNDLQGGFTNDDVSTGEAFETAFRNSLNYLMVNNTTSSDLLPFIFFIIIWYTAIIGSIISVIRSFFVSRRTYEEVPMENAGSNIGTNMSGYNAGNNYGANMAGNNMGSNYGTNMPGNNIGSNYGTNMPGNNIGSNYGTSMAGNNTGSNYGTDMSGNNIGSNYGANMSGSNIGSNYGTNMFGYNTGNNYGTSMSDYNLNNGSGSDYNYQNDDQKYSQDNTKTGGGYILNGEYYDASGKKS